MRIWWLHCLTDAPTSWIVAHLVNHQFVWPSLYLQTAVKYVNLVTMVKTSFSYEWGSYIVIMSEDDLVLSKSSLLRMALTHTPHGCCNK